MPETTTMTPIALDLRLRVLIQRESAPNVPQGAFVAQCLDYDFAVQGDTIHQIKTRFERVLMGHIYFALKYDETPFANLQPAPAKYWSLWEGAEELKDSLPVTLPGDRIPHNARQTRERVPRGEAYLRIA